MSVVSHSAGGTKSCNRPIILFKSWDNLDDWFTRLPQKIGVVKKRRGSAEGVCGVSYGFAVLLQLILSIVIAHLPKADMLRNGNCYMWHDLYRNQDI